MSRSRILVVCLLCLVVAAVVPAAGLAQTSGRAQYGGTNPLGPSGPSAQAAQQASSGTLPFTGRDLVLTLLAGTGLVGLGFSLRTTAARAPTAR